MIAEPRYHFEDPETWSGIALLLIGWLGQLAEQPAWFANPVLFVGWIMLARFAFGGPCDRPGLASIIGALVALALSAGVFLLIGQLI